MRPLPPLAALALAAAVGVAIASAGPSVAAARGLAPVAVLVVADVGESAQRTMPAALWRKLAADYVGARTVTAEDGTTLPDDAHCRGAHALYAVLATFDRAMRLPGMQQDPDRAYGVARFTVRNCLTGIVAPTKTVRIESDPLTPADRVEEPDPERTWGRPIRRTLARDPLVLTAVARIVRVENGMVYLESGSGFVLNQVLRDFADTNAKPHPPIDLIVQDTTGKYVQASVIGKTPPQPGDYVEAAPPAK